MRLIFRKAIVYILLVLLVIYILAYNGVIFSDRFYIRRDLSILLTFAFIAFIASRRPFENIFKKDAKQKAKPGTIPMLIGCILIFILLFSMKASLMNLKDAKRIYNKNAIRFQQIANMRKVIMATNYCAKCEFDYHRSGFHKDCDSSLNGKHADFVLSDSVQDTMTGFMSDLQISDIIFEENKVSFYFDFVESPAVIMLDSVTSENTKELVRINQHFFLHAEKD